MSSYGSTHSGYIHPSQYTQKPQHQYQQQHAPQPQPPYPTTPSAAPTSQPQAYFPPTPQQHQTMYSTSPASPWNQPTSPWTQPQNSYPPPHHSHPTSLPHTHRRSSSTSTSASSHAGAPHPSFPHSTAPIPIPQQHIHYTQPGPPVYARSAGSQHVHDHHTYGDGEDGVGVLDEETLRAYEKRYAKDRALEKRPTLGGSVLSMFRVLGGKRE